MTKDEEIVMLKEQLSRVEAERDQYARVASDALAIFRESAAYRDAAQAYLAEAVGLLKALNGNPSYADHVRADDFLARAALAAHPAAHGDEES